MFKIVTVTRAVCAVGIVLAGGGRAAAQGFEVTFFVGRAFPTYDERLTLRPSTPTVPGVDVTVDGSPLIEASGGPVFGGALAYEWGILGIEGRLDATDVSLDLTGARYNLRGTAPPFDGLTARITVSDGTFDADRIGLLSANVRIRTPGPVALIVSGGLSYLPDINVTGSHSAAGGSPGRSTAARFQSDAHPPRGARPVGATGGASTAALACESAGASH